MASNIDKSGENYQAQPDIPGTIRHNALQSPAQTAVEALIRYGCDERDAEIYVDLVLTALASTEDRDVAMAGYAVLQRGMPTDLTRHLTRTLVERIFRAMLDAAR